MTEPQFTSTSRELGVQSLLESEHLVTRDEIEALMTDGRVDAIVALGRANARVEIGPDPTT